LLVNNTNTSQATTWLSFNTEQSSLYRADYFKSATLGFRH